MSRSEENQTELHVKNSPSTLSNDSSELLKSMNIYSSPIKPFMIEESDMVVEWKEGMVQSLIRLVRHQQRGTCSKVV